LAGDQAPWSGARLISLPSHAQCLYAHDNILAIVRVLKGDTAQAAVDAEMEELFAALP
jgi:hypothetical protein